MKKLLGAALAVALMGVGMVGVAQESTAGGAKPLVTVSFAGYDQLMSAIQKAAQRAGRPEVAKMVEQMFATQDKGLAGLDRARPWGVVVSAAPGGEFPIQAFIPVTDLNQLMSLAPLPMKPDAAGVYELPGRGGKTFYAAQKGQWAFIVDSKDALGSVPADPSAALGELSKKYLLAVRGSVKNLPPEVCDLAIAKAKEKNAMTQGPRPGETEEQAAIRTNVANKTVDALGALAKELDGVLLGVAMDAGTGAIRLDAEITAQPGTKTAQRFAAVKDAQTNFAGFRAAGAAVTVLSAGTMDDADVAIFKAVSAKARTMALRDIDGNNDLTSEQKQLAKKLLGDGLDVFQKTIENRKSDCGLALLLDAGAPTLVAGMAVAEGAKLEKVLKQLVAEAAKEEPNLAKLVKLDADKHEGVNFHVATVPIPDPEAAAVLGKDLTIVVGIGSESLYLGVGKNALATLKQAIDNSKSQAGKSVPPLEIVVAAGPIARFIAEAARDNVVVGMLAGQVAEVLAASGGKDRVRLVARPIPNGGGAQLTIDEGILKAILTMAPVGGPPGGPMGNPGGNAPPPAGPAGNDPF
ncbi:MAG: hypothetical protein ABR915_10980 [Thermoguttaceae bacterium]